jgi:hypothetical protein
MLRVTRRHFLLTSALVLVVVAVLSAWSVMTLVCTVGLEDAEDHVRAPDRGAR